VVIAANAVPRSVAHRPKILYCGSALFLGLWLRDRKYPICIDGALNCPPDLCGGVWRYYQKLKIMKDVNHKDHKEILEWMGEDFDPELFDKELINEKL